MIRGWAHASLPGISLSTGNSSFNMSTCKGALFDRHCDHHGRARALNKGVGFQHRELAKGAGILGFVCGGTRSRLSDVRVCASLHPVDCLSCRLEFQWLFALLCLPAAERTDHEPRHSQAGTYIHLSLRTRGSHHTNGMCAYGPTMRGWACLGPEPIRVYRVEIATRCECCLSPLITQTPVFGRGAILKAKKP